ncbi:TPA: phage major tail protein, TP901-1 family [Staphylococcus aureus]|nr:phage major tail protein, TP901-1 family [Staphylococcus aureus]
MPQKSGKDELVLLRILGQKVDAEKVMLVTEHSRSTEKDKDSVETMDGSISAGGSLESEVKFTAHMDVQDKLSDEIEDAVEDDVAYELWFINRQVKNTDGKYKAEYRQGYFTSFERKNEDDGIAEYEAEYSVFGKKKRGYATLPKLIEDNKLAYGFHDTVKTDPATDGLASIPQPTASEASGTVPVV